MLKSKAIFHCTIIPMFQSCGSMDPSEEEFEVLDVAHDDVYSDRGEISAGVEDNAVPKQSTINEEKDRSENIVQLSLSDLDLADFVRDDLSPYECKQQSDSEFSFLELPELEDGEREGSLDGDYAGPATPASSAWSLLDDDFSSDSDRPASESVGSSPSAISDEEFGEQTREEISSACNSVENLRETRKRRRKRKKKSDGLMMELFGGLSVCQIKEDAGLPGFVESSSGLPTSNIPTLTDLCMQKIHLYRKSHLIKSLMKSSEFPVGMRRNILSSNVQYSLTKSKLSWLWRNLEVLENKLTDYCKKYPTSSDKTKLALSFYCVSDIWKETDKSVLMDSCEKDKENHSVYHGIFVSENLEYYLGM
jgi:hypothetical protein